MTTSWRRRPIVLGALAPLLLGVGAPAARAADALAVVDAYMAAWNAHDPDKAAAHLAPDAVYLDASVGTPQQGREAARDNVIKAFIDAAPDCTWERLGDPVVAGDNVAFEWRFSGTNTGDWADGTKATGKPFAFQGATLIRVKDGLIVHQADYYDALGFYKQLGLM